MVYAFADDKLVQHYPGVYESYLEESKLPSVDYSVGAVLKAHS